MTDDLTRKHLERALDAAGIDGAEILDGYAGPDGASFPAIVLHSHGDAFALLASLGFLLGESGEVDPDDLAVIAGRTRLASYGGRVACYWPGVVLARGA